MSNDDLEIQSDYKLDNINNDEINYDIISDNYENKDNIISEGDKEYNIPNNDDILEKPVEPEIYQPLNSDSNPNKIQELSNNENVNEVDNNFQNKEKMQNNISELIKKSNLNKNTQKEKYIQDKLLKNY